MKTERAIKLLHRLQDEQFDGIHGDERREALSMAVRALEQNLVKESGDLVKDLVKDCISRQQAIDAVKDLPNCRNGFSDTYDKACIIGVLEDLPAAQTQWISCSERLPEANGRYLVTRGLNACGALWNRVYIINYTDLMGLKSGRIWWDGNVGKSDFEQIADVIAWMPLPKPYGGDAK